MTTLKLVKSKKFSVKGVEHTHYTGAYKGRVFGISTLRFDTEDISVMDDIITINTDIEVIVEESTDPLDGKTRKFLTIVPKCGIAIAAY